MARITGNHLDNLLSGTNEADYLDGGAGNDILRARKGDDVLYGRSGDDRLFGDAGNDFLDGGAGRDYLDGGADQDTLRGGDGDDQMFGRDGNDRLFGGFGDDVMFGGIGDDTLSAGAGHDVLTGNHGADVFRFDFESASLYPDSYQPSDWTEATVTDFQSGIDKLAMSFTNLEDGTITFQDVLEFGDLDTNDDHVVNGLDDQVSAESGNLTIAVNELWQVVDDRLMVAGSVTLQDVTELRAGDFVA